MLWQIKTTKFYPLVNTSFQTAKSIALKLHFKHFAFIIVSVRVSVWNVNLKMLRLSTYVDFLIQNDSSYGQGQYIELKYLAVTRSGERFGTYWSEQRH